MEGELANVLDRAPLITDITSVKLQKQTSFQENTNVAEKL